MSLAGKVVLITGAASGMGAGAARAYAAEGATLILIDRNKIAGKFDNALKIQVDLTHDDKVEEAVNGAMKKFGRLDILLNVAGTTVLGNLKTTSLEVYDSIMAVNLRAVFHLTKLCAPHLIKTKGCIVNVSSSGSMKVETTYTVYSMTKVALDYFTKSLAIELAPSGVRVNAINPGPANTPLLTGIGLGLGDLAKQVPLKRIGNVEEMVRAMMFLTDDAASFITGQLLVVDGGVSLT